MGHLINPIGFRLGYTKFWLTKFSDNFCQEANLDEYIFQQSVENMFQRRRLYNCTLIVNFIIVKRFSKKRLIVEIMLYDYLTYNSYIRNMKYRKIHLMVLLSHMKLYSRDLYFNYNQINNTFQKNELNIHKKKIFKKNLVIFTFMDHDDSIIKTNSKQIYKNFVHFKRKVKNVFEKRRLMEIFLEKGLNQKLINTSILKKNIIIVKLLKKANLLETSLKLENEDLSINSYYNIYKNMFGLYKGLYTSMVVKIHFFRKNEVFEEGTEIILLKTYKIIKNFSNFFIKKLKHIFVIPELLKMPIYLNVMVKVSKLENQLNLLKIIKQLFKNKKTVFKLKKSMLLRILYKLDNKLYYNILKNTDNLCKKPLINKIKLIIYNFILSKELKIYKKIYFLKTLLIKELKKCRYDILIRVLFDSLKNLKIFVKILKRIRIFASQRVMTQKIKKKTFFKKKWFKKFKHFFLIPKIIKQGYYYNLGINNPHILFNRKNILFNLGMRYKMAFKNITAFRKLNLILKFRVNNIKHIKANLISQYFADRLFYRFKFSEIFKPILYNLLKRTKAKGFLAICSVDLVERSVATFMYI